MTDQREGASAEADEDRLSAVVKVLPLPQGIFMFSVAANSAPPALGAGGLKLPSIHVALGPDVVAGQVELMAGAETHGNWLYTPGNILIAKVSAAGATLVLTSVRSHAGNPLSIKIERMDAPPSAAVESEQSKLIPIQDPKRDGLRVRVNAHIRTRGDLSFVDTLWAGRVEPGLWMEAFSVLPLEQLGDDEIEYKGLTASGFETPWLSGGASCGTRGMSVPLVGFAIRPKHGSNAASNYDCEYSGLFQSGSVVGPLRNGTPCRSTQANDPLEGIMVKIVERKAMANSAMPSTAKPAPSAGRVVGPAFSKLREEAAAAVAGLRGNADQKVSKTAPPQKKVQDKRGAK